MSDGIERLSGDQLGQAWADLMAAEPKLRIRDAADRLGVSEAELLATRIGTDGVTRLKGPFGKFIEAAPGLGKVMVLTRNPYVVHEKIGTFDKVDIGPGHGIVLDRNIDLRLFLNRWHLGFAVIDQTDEGPRRSLHFFDGDGTAVHKIYLKEADKAGAFDALVAANVDEDQSVAQTVMTPVPQKPDAPDGEIDKAGLRTHWAALKDTHDFIHLLRDYGVGRQQALRLAGEEFAVPLAEGAYTTLFEAARDRGVPIMVFVSNAGCVQIHTGSVENIKVMGPWFNVLDPSFNLHLRGDQVASAWLVRKPTSDGIVTSVELFASDGTLILQTFGERKPGQVELEPWRELAEGLPRAQDAAA